MSEAQSDLLQGEYHAVNKMRCEFFAPGAPQGITHTELKLWHCDSTDHGWRSQYLHDIPDYLSGYFGQRYETLLNSPKDGRRRANTFLRNTIGKSVLPRLKLVNAAWQRDYSTGMPSPFKDSWSVKAARSITSHMARDTWAACVRSWTLTRILRSV